MGVYLGQSVYNGSQVTPEWVEEEIEKNGKGVFFATYGQTTYQNILQEYNNGKIIVVNYEPVTPGATTTYYFNLVKFNTETFDFVGVMRDGTIYRTSINVNEGWTNVTTHDNVKTAVFECSDNGNEQNFFTGPTYSELEAARTSVKAIVLLVHYGFDTVNDKYFVLASFRFGRGYFLYEFIEAKEGRVLKFEGIDVDTEHHTWSRDNENNTPIINRFLPPVPRDSSAVDTITSYAINIPIDSSYTMGWLLTALRAPCSGIVKSGSRFELRFNAFPYFNDLFDVYFGLAKLTGIDNSNNKQRFDIISQKIAPRRLTGISNSLLGPSGNSPLIFTFVKDVKFDPDEYIYLMIGVKRADLSVSPITLLACPCVAQVDYNNPINRLCMAHNCYQRDVNSTFADSTGIIADNFELGYSNPEDNFMARIGWGNSFAYSSIAGSDVIWSVSANGTPAIAELYLMKVGDG